MNCVVSVVILVSFPPGSFQSNKGRVTASGTYVPPKTQSGPPSTAVVAAVAPPLSTGVKSVSKGHQGASGVLHSARPTGL